jgi:hypothetical protein
MIDEKKTLRAELNRVNSSKDLLDQQREVDDLRKVHPHTCQIVKTRPSDPEVDYPAFAFALGLHEIPLIIEHKRDVFAGWPFDNPNRHNFRATWRHFYGVAFHFMEPIEESAVQDGDVVFYLTEKTDELTEMNVHHAGLVSGDKILSKWGGGEKSEGTNIWLHEVDEVPSFYEDADGDITVRYFRPDREQIADYFLRGIERRA